MNILVVDDEPALRQLIRRFLHRDFSVKILEADDGQTALDRLFKEKEPVDLVLLDLSMKVMGGIETLEAIRRSDTHARLPVVLMTAQADEQYVRRAVELGIAGFIVKPFTPETLRERLANLIRERQSTQGAAAAPTRDLDIDASHAVLVVDESREFRTMAAQQISRLCAVDDVESDALALKRCLGEPFDLLLIGAMDGATAGTLARKVRETPALRRVRLAAAVPPEAIAATTALGLFDAVLTRSVVEETFAASLHRSLGQGTLARLLFHPTSPCLVELWSTLERGMSRWLGAGLTLHDTPQVPSGDARWVTVAVEFQGSHQAWELRMRFQYPVAIDICQARNRGEGDRISEQRMSLAVGRAVAELVEEFRPRLQARGLTVQTWPARVTTTTAAQPSPPAKQTDTCRWLVTSTNQVVPIELASITKGRTGSSRPAGVAPTAPPVPATTR